MDEKPTVYYNGGCPVCSLEIGHYKKLSGSEDLNWCDLAEHPDALAERGISANDAKKRLYTVDSDGRLIDGVDSFEAIWSRLPRYRWLKALTRTRPGRAFGNFVYNRIAVPVLARLNRLD